MTDHEFMLEDRITKIQSVINQYGEENFFLSFSGGKDSTVLSALLDMALPDNQIPRVYANTGIELNMVRNFVFDMAAKDNRVVIIKPSVPIKKMLEKKGYPFKSKMHSAYYTTFINSGRECKTIQRYLKLDPTVKKYRNDHCCPNKLKYQFESPDAVPFMISDHCCDEMKKKPLAQWQRQNNRPYKILGIMTSEGGQRAFKAQCLAFSGEKLKAFQPLVSVTKEWEDWFIDEYNIEICDIYKPPYNFQRTGCKGCPFAIDLQRELDILDEYFPTERKQCELIWKPVYEEYRRLGYRLKDDKQIKLTDFIKNAE